MTNMDNLISTILAEAQNSKYSIYSGVIKIYGDLRKHYRWYKIKWDIVYFVTKCQNKKQVKYEHWKHSVTFKRMPISK